MRMPNPREVDRALFVEFIKLKKCGVSVKFSPWSEDVDTEGLLEVAWVRIGKIPPNKRNDKTVAYVGGLVGVTLEVDMSTLNRPTSVRAKIGCRFVDQLPATAEGMLGGRFYKFTYEIEEVLVRNPVEEGKGTAVQNDNVNKTDQTPKRKRADHELAAEQLDASASENPGTSFRGGKTCRLLSQENEDSSSFESDDNSLLIESMARDHKEGAQKEQQNTSGWLVPVDTNMGHTHVEHGTPGQSVQVTKSPVKQSILSYAEVVMNSSQVMELEGGVDPGMKISKDYVVQLPASDCDDEMILTPPLVPEDLPRLSKRNVQGMQDHVMAKAAKMASKKNLEGNSHNARKNSFAILSDAELISRVSNMGVTIPDNDFACIDVLRELEHVRKNLEEKTNLGKLDQSGEDDIFVTNGLGKKAPVNLTWLDQDEVIHDKVAPGKLKKKTPKKPVVKLSRPVTRSQRKVPEGSEKCSPAMPPGGATKSKFHKKRSR
ncbi:hypothetical protein VPH35_024235 [Triticum aestivum]